MPEPFKCRDCNKPFAVHTELMDRLGIKHRPVYFFQPMRMCYVCETCLDFLQLAGEIEGMVHQSVSWVEIIR